MSRPHGRVTATSTRLRATDIHEAADVLVRADERGRAMAETRYLRVPRRLRMVCCTWLGKDRTYSS